MAYIVPQMPLNVNVWHAAAVIPPIGAPSLTTMGNLAWNKRVAVPSTGGTSSLGVPLFTMTLLLAAGTDVRDRQAPGGPDIVEVPAGSGRFYEVVYVDDIGKGFDNEHRAALLLSRQRPYPLP